MSLFENPVGKVPPNIIFLDREINELTGYVLHLTPHSAYLSWGTDVHRFHSTGQKPMCDRCDINCDRRDIKDKVKQKLIFIFKLSLYLVGMLVYMIKITFSENIMKKITLIKIVIP